LKKFALLFATIICFAMISGSFAATNQNVHKLTMTVPSNPTTGYHWVATYNHQKVKLVSEKYTPTLPIMCGSGGHETFVFSGVKGEKVTLRYVGPGKHGEVAKTIVYYIK